MILNIGDVILIDEKDKKIGKISKIENNKFEV